MCRRCPVTGRVALGLQPRSACCHPRAVGHILTGRHVVRDAPDGPQWTEARAPLTLETSLTGVFAAGDVRHNSPRGVAAAVADGATASRSVYEYLHGV